MSLDQVYSTGEIFFHKALTGLARVYKNDQVDEGSLSYYLSNIWENPKYQIEDFPETLVVKIIDQDGEQEIYRQLSHLPNFVTVYLICYGYLPRWDLNWANYLTLQPKLDSFACYYIGLEDCPEGSLFRYLSLRKNLTNFDQKEIDQLLLQTFCAYLQANQVFGGFYHGDLTFRNILVKIPDAEKADLLYQLNQPEATNSSNQPGVNQQPKLNYQITNPTKHYQLIDLGESKIGDLNLIGSKYFVQSTKPDLHQPQHDFSTFIREINRIYQITNHQIPANLKNLEDQILISQNLEEFTQAIIDYPPFRNYQIP